MVSKYVPVLALLVLFALLHSGTSLKCYECSKNTDKACDDPLSDESKTKFLTDCPSNSTHCLKVVHPYDGDARYRKCGVEPDCNIYTECYACKGDEPCNSSTTATFSFVMIAICGALVAKRYF